jgi:hypothetical protein
VNEITAIRYDTGADADAGVLPATCAVVLMSPPKDRRTLTIINNYLLYYHVIVRSGPSG